MEVSFNNLERQYHRYQKEYENKALKILREGSYILGEEVEKFENEFSKFIGTDYAVGVDNGLNALVLTIRALGIGNGDEIIVQANTFIASVMSITMNGAIPVFVEPDEFFNIDVDKIEEKITSKTKAILVVHLYGQASNMERIVEICKKYNLKLIEDCAQSHGASFNGINVGSFGIGCFSLYPSKPLGAFGDAGIICANDYNLIDTLKMLRNYGSEKRYYNKVVGYNSRLDELQAGLLRVKLNHFDELTEERRIIAQRYLNEINNKWISLPKIRNGATHVWHLFVVQVENREKLIKYLEKNNVGSLVHYPIPPHLSEAYEKLGYKEGSLPITEKYAKTVLSLPLYNGMTDEEISFVINTINKFNLTV